MKIEAIKKLGIAKLTEVALQHGISLKGKDSKEAIAEAVVLHFHPAPADPAPATEEAKTEALENSKAAKAPLTHRVKLAKVFDTFACLLTEKQLTEEKPVIASIPGVVATFWKAKEGAADFGGMTLRFDDKADSFGADRAIVHNIRKALKGAGIPVNTVTIRRAGALCMWA